MYSIDAVVHNKRTEEVPFSLIPNASEGGTTDGLAWEEGQSAGFGITHRKPENDISRCEGNQSFSSQPCIYNVWYDTAH